MTRQLFFFLALLGTILGFSSQSWAQRLPDQEFHGIASFEDTDYHIAYFSKENEVVLEISQGDGVLSDIDKPIYKIHLNKKTGKIDSVEIGLKSTTTINFDDKIVTVFTRKLQPIENKEELRAVILNIIGLMNQVASDEDLLFYFGDPDELAERIKQPALIDIGRQLIQSLADGLRKDPLLLQPSTLGHIKSEKATAPVALSTDNSIGQPAIPKNRAEGQVPLPPETGIGKRRRR